MRRPPPGEEISLAQPSGQNAADAAGERRLQSDDVRPSPAALRAAGGRSRDGCLDASTSFPSPRPDHEREGRRGTEPFRRKAVAARRRPLRAPQKKAAFQPLRASSSARSYSARASSARSSRRSRSASVEWSAGSRPARAARRRRGRLASIPPRRRRVRGSVPRPAIW
jgi:hypothetical protein